HQKAQQFPEHHNLATAVASGDAGSAFLAAVNHGIVDEIMNSGVLEQIHDAHVYRTGGADVRVSVHYQCCRVVDCWVFWDQQAWVDQEPHKKRCLRQEPSPGTPALGWTNINSREYARAVQRCSEDAVTEVLNGGCQ
ncbi:MAG: hypothetical protein L0Z55_10215, partial [Planctomycetes bacterium]|nr:hypothetical protein [Planctomycetota bacterium]